MPKEQLIPKIMVATVVIAPELLRGIANQITSRIPNEANNRNAFFKRIKMMLIINPKAIPRSSVYNITVVPRSNTLR